MRTGRSRSIPIPHYDPAAKTDTNHPHYGDPAYTEQFYTDYTQEVKSFFTLQNDVVGILQVGRDTIRRNRRQLELRATTWVMTVKAMKPDDLISKHNGVKEEAAVTPGQHPVEPDREIAGRRERANRN